MIEKVKYRYILSDVRVPQRLVPVSAKKFGPNPGYRYVYEQINTNTGPYTKLQLVMIGFIGIYTRISPFHFFKLLEYVLNVVIR
jgi:hypothetical protein